MSERLAQRPDGPVTGRPDPAARPPVVVATPRRAWQRALGALLLIGTIGVASCQALLAADPPAGTPAAPPAATAR